MQRMDYRNLAIRPTDGGAMDRLVAVWRSGGQRLSDTRRPGNPWTDEQEAV